LEDPRQASQPHDRWLSTVRPPEWWSWLLGAAMFLPFLGSLGLWDPWEPHYAEVAREMLARRDLVHPHWESAYFFSKPAMTLWMIAGGLWVTAADAGPPGAPLGAWMAWGVRLPFALVAMATVWAAFRIGRLVGGAWAGLAAAVVLATCPQFIFIGKQAIADMPLVGFMTVGLAMFLEAVFGEDAAGPPSAGERLGMAAVVGGLGFGQVAILGSQVEASDQAAALAALAAGVSAAILLLWVYGRRRDCKLGIFYALMAAAALSKGLAVLAVVGPVVLVYLLFSLDFGLLGRSGVLWGGPLFLMLASPWYVALSFFEGRDDEGLTFYRRFWIHDNLNRVGSGVHGDRGGLGYHFEQLAYGMFPWSALLPSAVLRALEHRDDATFRNRRILLFLVLWGLWTYVFFSASLTKFHHYIFPAVPALAILVGVWFAWVAEDPKERLRGGHHVVVAALFAVAAVDLVHRPQHLVNLFTYKYDRNWPIGTGSREFIIAWVVVTSVGLVALHAVHRRGLQQAWFALAAVGFGVWCSHVYFNLLTPHWSQYHVFETFHEARRPGEPLYAYQLNWRGETFYSRNQVIQVMNKGANRRMRELVDRPGREFILTEQRRYKTLRGVLSPEQRDKMKIIDQSNASFYLILVED
jgi:4-amino-4-deoxy-L-arabinose transferase-like glycosyltransferase